jgi:hypothetical protein
LRCGRRFLGRRLGFRGLLGLRRCLVAGLLIEQDIGSRLDQIQGDLAGRT